MTKISVVVESKLSGSMAGFKSLAMDDSKPVQELINQYCSVKGAPVRPSYGLVAKGNMVLVNKLPISEFFLGEGEALQLITLENGSTLGFAQWLIMAGLAMLVAVVGLISCFLLYLVFSDTPDNYAMVINAGSAQTDMTLYSWPSEKVNGTGEVFQTFSCIAPGGLAQLPPENISAYLEPCFEQSYEAIFEKARKNPEVLFGATGEMRLLNETDPTAASAIMASVLAYISSASNWRHNPGNIGILPGPAEGVSSWITANFLERTIHNKSLVNTTFGTLDLGDISTQIALEVDESFKSSPDVYPVTLFGNRYYVFSQSYLCNGLDQALIRYRALLWLEQNKSINISSPCEPLGLEGRLPDSYFSGVCTNHVQQKLNETDEALTIIGTGDYAECQRTVSKLLSHQECMEGGMGYCVDPAQLPADVTSRPYHAFSAFNDIILRPGAQLSLVERYLKAMCDYDMGNLRRIKDNSVGTEQQFDVLCFEGQYMFTLLTQVYGFSTEEEWSQITFTDQVEGWSLGYMVNATADIDEAEPIPRLKIFPFSLLIILFIIFIFLGVGFTVHGFRVRRNSSGYRRKHLLMMDEQMEKFIPFVDPQQQSHFQGIFLVKTNK